MPRICTAAKVTTRQRFLRERTGLMIGMIAVGIGCSSDENPPGTTPNPASGQAGTVGVTGGSAASGIAGASGRVAVGASGSGGVPGAAATSGSSGVAGRGGSIGASGTTDSGGISGASGSSGVAVAGSGAAAAGAGAGAAGSGEGESDVACTGDKGADATVQTYTQEGKAPSGPTPIVIETEPTLAGYTIYRPKDLTEKYPQFVFMNGGCMLEGVGAFSEVLSEVASYGFIVVTVGNPAGGGSETLSTDPTSMLKPLDWLYVENDRPCSKYYHKVLMDKAAMSGQSCGGVHAIGAGKDPRVATVVSMNSGLTGMATNSQAALTALHGSIAYLIGGQSDIASSPAQSDYAALPKSLPAWYGDLGQRRTLLYFWSRQRR